MSESNKIHKIYRYLRPETGDIEDVYPERWRWCVNYGPDRENLDPMYDFRQFNDIDGTFHQFKEVQQDEVTAFMMYSLETPQKFVIFPPNGAELVHFYRRRGISDEQGQRIYATNYCFGFGVNIDGKVHKTIFMIDENDQLYVGDGDFFTRLAVGDDIFYAIGG